MKTLIQKSRLVWGRLALASMLLLAMPLAALHAQEAETKPVAVISVSPIKKILADTQYLADAAGQSDFGRMAAIMSSPFTQGIDKTRPIGVVVMTNGQEFSPLAFIPVTDMDSLLLIIKEQFGPAQDMGNDVKMLPTPMPVFVKQSGDWAFVAMDMDKLSNVPAAPADLLKTLPTDYDFAVQLYPGNVPEIYQSIMVSQMKAGVELSLEQEPDETDEEFAARKEQINAQLNDINRLFTEISDLTIGWNVDASQQATYIDVKYTAVEGSQLAEQLALNTNLTTEFSGFNKKGAAFNLIGSQKTPPEEAEKLAKQIDDAREQAIRQLETDGELEGEELESAKKVVDLMIDTLVQTIRTGSMDLGMMVDLDGGKAVVLAGMHVADGKRVEDGFKELMKLLESEKNVPEVKWDAESYQAVRFHVMEIPMDDAPPEAKEILGAKPTLVVGIADKSVYFSFGNDSVARLKKAIDDSVAGTATPLNKMMEMNISLLPILTLAEKHDKKNAAALNAAVEALSAGNDQILLKSEVNGLEARGRFMIQEGVIKAFGAGMAAQNAARDFDQEEAPAF
ncbi:hypothetical protein DTL42_07450 [Bremerella cremea]|uniref:Uncharacterized protein n=1 Tax=Bremerella cremea TaxID=1031537 RepID=A0A368KSM3_9BACT|nr:hypothetical protein [Bremerella cremea]RCS52667.1 hypothetical protein DTL42_07450 [Bremerella cremea]